MVNRRPALRTKKTRLRLTGRRAAHVSPGGPNTADDSLHMTDEQDPAPPVVVSDIGSRLSCTRPSLVLPGGPILMAR